MRRRSALNIRAIGLWLAGALFFAAVCGLGIVCVAVAMGG